MRPLLLSAYRSLRHASTSSAHASPITPRAVSFSKWYQSVLTCGDVIDPPAHTPVRGCVIYRPHGFALWEHIRNDLDARIRATGAVNVYFPLLLPLSYMSREAAHVHGFASECAVVTHTRLQAVTGEGGDTRMDLDPASRLTEPYIIRPTSETVIWSTLRRWIRSHADLPMLLNQWANVVRWERRPRPLTRNAEFLWQEGHTAHATREEAHNFSLRMLQLYAAFFREQLAVPVIMGEKSPSERFAGADRTYTCEAIMQNGWALQSATSHSLGDNFARAFDVHYTCADGTRSPVYATSWGASTRMLGAVVMTHGDDTGLVLPPRIAPHQVVIVPIPPPAKAGAEVRERVLSAARDLASRCSAAGIRIVTDNDVHTAAGARFFAWERKGVPLRMELGARDLSKNQVTIKSRARGTSTTLCLDHGAAAAVARMLEEEQAALLASAQARVDACMHPINKYSELREHAGAHDVHAAEDDEASARTFLAPWYEDSAAEARVKAETRYSIRCYPSQHQAQAAGAACFLTGKPATHIALFARAY